ncbi:MAG: P27 family phage terminase small subunit [Muribaculaceae bacterium]|nr:P27 family phage terminase small subunit [Muribaculaceae bacterium]
MKYKKIELPDNLHPLALKFVKSIINTFDDENKLNALDEMVFYTLASWLNTFIICSERVDTEGMTITTPRGIVQLSPYATQMKIAQSHLNVLVKEMGLSLGSRGKIKAVSTMTEDSPLATFLKGNK